MKNINDLRFSVLIDMFNKEISFIATSKTTKSKQVSYSEMQRKLPGF